MMQACHSVKRDDLLRCFFANRIILHACVGLSHSPVQPESHNSKIKINITNRYVALK
jgi:hypothetical protein